MSKIIVKNELGDSLEQELNAMKYVTIVMEQGKISGNDDQYCFVTYFYEVQDVSDIIVYADMTKNGTHVFRVSRRYL